jgi:pilus assembly protein CpaD
MLRVRLNQASSAGSLKMIAAAVLTVSALSGCGAFQNRHNIIVGSVPDDYRTNHPIILNEREEMLDVPVAASDTHITIAQRGSIQGFITQYASNGSGVVQVLLPAGAPNSAAAQRVRPYIVKALQSAGVPRGSIIYASYDASGAQSSAPVRISYRAMSAGTEPCGKWDADLGDTSENKNYQNFGCASQNNFAAMIANPADLIGPRAPDDIDPVRRGLAISRYQKSTGVWSANTSYDW